MWSSMLIAIESLHPLCSYPDDWPGLRELYADLDERGMVNPLEVLPMTREEWDALPPCHPKLKRPPPPPEHAFVAIKRGNQRVRWARERGLEALECEFIS